MDRVKAEGLSTFYKANKQFRLFVTKMTALAFVPINDVAGLWGQLKLDIDQTCPRKKSLIDYFDNVYIGSNREALFPIGMWNQRRATLSCTSRTTNCCESYHNRLNGHMKCFHPNIEIFIRKFNEVIQNEKFGRVHETGNFGFVDEGEQELAFLVEMYDEYEDKMVFVTDVAKMVQIRSKERKKQSRQIVR